MEATLQRNVRNSEMSVAKDKRAFLTYPASGLVSCKLEATEESVNFVFDAYGMESAEEVVKKPKWEQLRFLVNCAGLDNLNLEYDFSLSLDNLMADPNLMPQILIRDAKKPSNPGFLERYKALIGSILQRKYKYEDYLNGGQDLYKKDEFLSELSELESVEVVRKHLFTEYQLIIQEMNETLKLVPKRNVLIGKIAIPVLAVALLAVSIFGGLMLFRDIPFRDNIITANTAYIHGDNISVQTALRGYGLPALSNDIRYILSRSYVSTEALTDLQRENILMGLTRMTDPILFDYWILLGRLYFGEAIDIAQRLGDDELLLFAYLKYEVFVRQDMSMPGEARTALLSYLEQHIDRLNRARDEAVIGDALNNPN